MEKILLTCNVGSTSLKIKAFSYETLRLIFVQNYEITEHGAERTSRERSIFETIISEAHKSGTIVCTAHRVVHGGPEFSAPTLLTPNVMQRLKKYDDFAPLHNPFAMSFIRTAIKTFPKLPHIAVFDTGFFADLPDVARIAPIPYEYFQKNIYRYGAHGISHHYLLEKTAELLHKPIKQCTIITAHLGGGASLAAIRNGKAVDTSIGFSPIGGVMMMTRSGDIDPGIILHLIKHHRMSFKDIEQMLNRKSGIFGISNTKTFLELLAGVKAKDPRCLLAFGAYTYKIKKFIGSYAAVLGHVDAIAFSGAIGAGSKETRKAILSDISFLKDVPIFAIKTDEELMIAKQAKKLLES